LGISAVIFNARAALLLCCCAQRRISSRAERRVVRLLRIRDVPACGRNPTLRAPLLPAYLLRQQHATLVRFAHHLVCRRGTAVFSLSTCRTFLAGWRWHHYAFSRHTLLSYCTFHWRLYFQPAVPRTVTFFLHRRRRLQSFCWPGRISRSRILSPQGGVRGAGELPLAYVLAGARKAFSMERHSGYHLHRRNLWLHHAYALGLAYGFPSLRHRRWRLPRSHCSSPPTLCLLTA